MQALNKLALIYATFEQAGTNLEVEVSEGDLHFADVRTAMEGLTEGSSTAPATFTRGTEELP